MRWRVWITRFGLLAAFSACAIESVGAQARSSIVASGIPPNESTSAWIALAVAGIGAVTSILIAIAASRDQRKKSSVELEFQRRKLEEELSVQRTQYATETSVEKALHTLLSLHHLRYRSFPVIRHHVGGFEPNELRKLLVRAGAVRFVAQDGTELWALMSRVEEDFKLSRWKHGDPPQNKPPAHELLPAALNDSTQL
jgi:hypothetical protein